MGMDAAPIPLRTSRASSHGDDDSVSPAKGELFSRHERRILESIAEAAIPAAGPMPGGGPATIDRLERWLGGESPTLASGLRALCWVVEMASVATHRGRFSRLSRSRRVELLERWERTGSQLWRAAFVGLLTPIKGMHFDDPGIHRAVGAPYGVAPPAQTESEPWMVNVIDGSTEGSDDTLECDVVIVGSGAGGGALAHDLASRGHGVLVLEAGRYFKRPDFNGRPIEMMRRMFLDHGMTLAIGNLGTPVWAGQTVGGTTTINSGTCYRTPDGVLEEWRRELGLSMMTPEAMDSHFAKVEQVMGIELARREHLGAIADVIARGADALGYAHGPLPRNAPDCDGQGLCCFGCPTGAKRSADVSWIPGALERGAMLMSSTRVERVDTDASTGRAIGVTARTAAGGAITVRAKATVIAGGSLMTPPLLMRSGIGGDNRWLGRNLSIHPAGKAVALFDDRQDMWEGIPQGYSIHEFQDEGIMFEGGSLPLSGAASAITTVGPRYSELMSRYRNMALFGFMLRDTSRGRVVQRPGGGAGGPSIFYNLNRHDTRRMQRGMEIMCEVFLEAGARVVVPGVTGAPEIRSREDLERFASQRWDASRFEVTAYHPLGTARMAASPDLGFVGPDHETFSIRDLFVVDGAAVPTSLGVNPQVTIMAMALRAGQILSRRIESRDALAA